MDGPVHVTFHFGRDVQAHNMTELPEPGDLVTHDRELWAVSSVAVDAHGMAVVCTRRPHAVRHLHALHDE